MSFFINKIEAWVTEITEYINNYVVPLAYKEPIDKIIKGKNDLKNISSNFLFSLPFYRACLPNVISLCSKSSETSKTTISQVLAILFLTNLNKSLSDGEGPLPFHRPAQIREAGIANHDKKDMRYFIWTLFNQWDFTNFAKKTNEWKDKYDEVMNKTVIDIIKLFIKSNNSKMNRFLIDWYLSNDSMPNDFLNRYTLEHVFESHNKQKKRKEGWSTILLESEIHHTKINKEKNNQVFSSQKKLAEWKVKYYKQSEHDFTKNYKLITNKKQAKEAFFKFYGDKLKDKISCELQNIESNEKGRKWRDNIYEKDKIDKKHQE